MTGGGSQSAADRSALATSRTQRHRVRARRGFDHRRTVRAGVDTWRPGRARHWPALYAGRPRHPLQHRLGTLTQHTALSARFAPNAGVDDDLRERAKSGGVGGGRGGLQIRANRRRNRPDARRSRYLFISEHRARFRTVLAGLSASSDEAGGSRSGRLGGRFFGDFQRPTSQTRSTESVHRDLMPKHTIYTAMLPERAGGDRLPHQSGRAGCGCRERGFIRITSTYSTATHDDDTNRSSARSRTRGARIVATTMTADRRLVALEVSGLRSPMESRRSGRIVLSATARARSASARRMSAPRRADDAGRDQLRRIVGAGHNYAGLSPGNLARRACGARVATRQAACRIGQVRANLRSARPGLLVTASAPDHASGCAVHIDTPTRGVPAGRLVRPGWGRRRGAVSLPDTRDGRCNFRRQS